MDFEKVAEESWKADDVPSPRYYLGYRTEAPSTRSIWITERGFAYDPGEVSAVKVTELEDEA